MNFIKCLLVVSLVGFLSGCSLFYEIEWPFFEADQMWGGGDGPSPSSPPDRSGSPDSGGPPDSGPPDNDHGHGHGHGPGHGHGNGHGVGHGHGNSGNSDK